MLICLSVTEDCQNLMESYGEICVRCNKCGRFDEGTESGDKDHEKAVEQMQHDMLYEPTYNQEDGSM